MPAETTAIHLISSSSFVRGLLLGTDSGFDSRALNPVDIVFPLDSGTIRPHEHTTALVLQQTSIGPSANPGLLITLSAALKASIPAGLKFPLPVTLRPTHPTIAAPRQPSRLKRTRPARRLSNARLIVWRRQRRNFT